MKKETCNKCTYVWNCKSTKQYVTCPNCHYNVRRKPLTGKDLARNLMGLNAPNK